MRIPIELLIFCGACVIIAVAGTFAIRRDFAALDRKSMMWEIFESFVAQLLMVLMLGGAVLALVFVLWLHPAGITLLGIAVMELLFFIPAIAAGACFTLAGAVERGDFGGDAGSEASEDAQPSR